MTREDVERIVREAHAKGERPDLCNANLSRANLRWADLCGANLSNANLSEAILYGANLSNVTGLVDPIDWIAENLEACADGYFAYKVFGLHYTTPDYWNVEAGAILSEVCHSDRALLCACGVNVGTLDWVQKNAGGKSYWKVLIRWPWLAGVVVPYNTDGKFRCSRCELVEEVHR